MYLQLLAYDFTRLQVYVYLLWHTYVYKYGFLRWYLIPDNHVRLCVSMFVACVQSFSSVFYSNWLFEAPQLCFGNISVQINCFFCANKCFCIEIFIWNSEFSPFILRIFNRVHLILLSRGQMDEEAIFLCVQLRAFWCGLFIYFLRQIFRRKNYLLLITYYFCSIIPVMCWKKNEN